MMMSILIIYGSSRANGNTESLTKLATHNIITEELYLSDYQIEPIIDQRHESDGFSSVTDDYQQVIKKVLAHDIIIFATPIYWYGMTGQMKNFIDRWSQMMRDKNTPHFQKIMEQKSAYVIAVGGDMPYQKGLPLIQQFQYIFNFIGMKFNDYIIGEANAPGEIIKDLKALFAAEQLRKHFAEIQNNK